jgi:hypothetical protein
MSLQGSRSGLNFIIKQYNNVFYGMMAFMSNGLTGFSD